MPQLYRRISAPYMPQGTPDRTNDPSPHYAPGELGCSFSDPSANREYLRVELDSGATAATAIGAVVAGQLAFWKDKTRALVTNDKNQCDAGAAGAINRVAGIFMTAVSATPGVNGTDGLPVKYMCDLSVRGLTPVVSTGTPVFGSQATADTTASQARAVTAGAVNTAPPSQILGVVMGNALSAQNTVPVDVYIAYQE